MTRHRSVMTVIISLVLISAGLYVLLSQQYTDDVQKWASGIIGMVVGFWLTPMD